MLKYSSEKNKDPLKQNNIIEISRIEVSANLLGMGYIHCNSNFAYMNTILLEYYQSTLKYLTNKELEGYHNEEEVVVNFNPNKERQYLNDI